MEKMPEGQVEFIVLIIQNVLCCMHFKNIALPCVQKIRFVGFR